MSKKDVHKAYLDACNSGITQVRIAEESGVPEASLRQFKRESALGDDYMEKLKMWLVARGFLIFTVAESSTPYGFPRNASLIDMAAALRGLIPLVEDEGARVETRLDLLETNLNALLNLVHRTRAAMARSPQS